MKRTASRLILHPFFFALYPILNLYTENLGQVTFSQVLRSLLVFLGLTLLALVFLRLLLKDWVRAGLATSVGLLMIFAFAVLQPILRSLFAGISDPVWRPGLAVAWVALFGLLVRFVGYRLRDSASLSMILNLVSGFLLLLVGVRLGFGLIGRQSPHPEPAKAAAVQVDLPQAAPPAFKPDIYYIIMDGYGQGQMLADLYGLDNSAFLDGLSKRGFTIAGDSHANYNQTILALASTLNLDYLDRLVQLYPLFNDRQPLIDLLKTNLVMRFVKEQGYQTISVASGYEFTEISGVDSSLVPRTGINPFETLLISGAVGEAGMNDLLTAAYRAEVLERFRLVEAAASRPGPKFVFVHLVMPHPPFVFDRTGKPVQPKNLTFSDASHLDLPPEEYVYHYSEQLLYANRLVEHMIDAILKNSPSEPLIILQGDHGPGGHLDWQSLENSCIRERLSILNAYYLPGGKTAEEVGIYPSITPVNSFRLLLDAYLGTNLGAIEDRSYFAIWERPQNLIDVTDRLDTCKSMEKTIQ